MWDCGNNIRQGCARANCMLMHSNARWSLAVLRLPSIAPHWIAGLQGARRYIFVLSLKAQYPFPQSPAGEAGNSGVTHGKWSKDDIPQDLIIQLVVDRVVLKKKKGSAHTPLSNPWDWMCTLRPSRRSQSSNGKSLLSKLRAILRLSWGWRCC